MKRLCSTRAACMLSALRVVVRVTSAANSALVSAASVGHAIRPSRSFASVVRLGCRNRTTSARAAVARLRFPLASCGTRRWCCWCARHMLTSPSQRFTPFAGISAAAALAAAGVADLSVFEVSHATAPICMSSRACAGHIHNRWSSARRDLRRPRCGVGRQLGATRQGVQPRVAPRSLHFTAW